MILAIDPGSEQSAFVRYAGPGMHILAPDRGIVPNPDLLEIVSLSKCQVAVIERIVSYGMAVGEDVYQTCFWIGRFWQAFCGPVHLITRKQVTLHLCNRARAKDSNVRQVLIDRFGPGKDKAIGKKATPGPLYGFKKDLWSALAVAVTWAETHDNGE